MDYINDIYSYFEDSARQLGETISNQIDNLLGRPNPANGPNPQPQPQPQRHGLIGFIINSYYTLSESVASKIIESLNNLEDLSNISLGKQFKVGAVLFFMILLIFYINFAFIVPICLGGSKLLYAYYTNKLDELFGWSLFIFLVFPYLVFLSVSFILNAFLIFYVYLAGKIVYRMYYNNQGALFRRIVNGVMYVLGLLCLALNCLILLQNPMLIKAISSIISIKVGTFIVYCVFIYSHIIMVLYIYRLIYNYFNTNPAEAKTQVYILPFKTLLVVIVFSILLSLALNGVFVDVLTPVLSLFKEVLYSSTSN